MVSLWLNGPTTRIGVTDHRGYRSQGLHYGVVYGQTRPEIVVEWPYDKDRGVQFIGVRAEAWVMGLRSGLCARVSARVRVR